MTQELKPCPFCGGEASLVGISVPVLADCADAFVACDECDAQGSPAMFDNDIHLSTDASDVEADAITAWNTRAPASPVDAAADDLLAALVDLCEAYASLCQQTGKTHHKVLGSRYGHARAAIAKATGQQVTA